MGFNSVNVGFSKSSYIVKLTLGISKSCIRRSLLRSGLDDRYDAYPQEGIVYGGGHSAADPVRVV